ncbi:MAG: hypothetical protein JKY40_06125, partial [Gammaproteobacteria bacterium]|nr:hypothetical protein [Gammaproteobacteria bacterium]
MLLILISTPIGIVLLRPDVVLNTLTKSALSQLGFEISSLEVTHLGINSVAVDELVLNSADQRVVLSRIHAQYSLSQLLAGTLQSLSIGKIELRSLSNSDTSNDETSTSLASLLESFDALAVSDIYLPNIEILNSDQSYRIGLGLQSPPLHIAGDAEFKGVPGAIIEFDIQRTDPRQLTIETKVLIAEILVSESAVDVNVAENAITVTATSSLFVEPLRA